MTFLRQGWRGLRGRDPELAPEQRWLGIAFVVCGGLQILGAILLLIAIHT